MYFLYKNVYILFKQPQVVKNLGHTMCSSRKYPCSPTEEIRNSRGVGVGVPKDQEILKKVWSLVGISRGVGEGVLIKQKLPSVGNVWIFYGTDQYYYTKMVMSRSLVAFYLCFKMKPGCITFYMEISLMHKTINFKMQEN